MDLTMFLFVLSIQVIVHNCNLIIDRDEKRGIGVENVGGSLLQRQDPDLVCPTDECECSKTDFITLYCCTCYNKTVLHEGFTNCPDNCIAYCPKSGTFHCCYCDGVILTTPTQPPTTETPTTATTKKPSSNSGNDCPCFPSMTRVSLENGKSVAISELQVGDQVQKVSSDGSLRFSTVRTFLKKQPLMTSMYKSFLTSGNTTITLSENHLIYARKNPIGKFVTFYADDISIGDEVLVHRNNELTPNKIINMSNIIVEGAHVPLTEEGNLVVDGVLASCYTSCPHDLNHIAMTPANWFPKVIEWLYGDDNGHLAYVGVLLDLGNWVLPDESLNI